jgi:ribosomal-protein-alanine N-acetyltransferase
LHSPLRLDLARPADTPGIAEMSRDLIEHGLGWSWTTRRVQASLRCRDTVVLRARRHDRLSGFAIMHFGSAEAHLLLLAVRPADRRGGIGHALVRWLEESALTAGLGVVYLEVRAGNAHAQRFYQHLGYRRIAYVPGYYSGREAAYRMASDLWARASGGGVNAV